MYALINTSTACKGLTIGRIISTHYTAENADRADQKLQREIRRNNPGGNAYLPTAVVKAAEGTGIRKGMNLHRDDVVLFGGHPDGKTIDARHQSD